MEERRAEALRLLEGGASSLRAVAAAVGAHHSSVRAWRLEAERTGEVPPVKFDRHGTRGTGWDDDDALKRQAVRAVRLERRTGRKPRAASADAGERDEESSSPSDAERWRPRRKPRARIMGPLLRERLGLPEMSVDDNETTVTPASMVPVTPASMVPVTPAQPSLPDWAVPALRTKITALLALWGGAQGLTIRALRERLGPAFEIDDSDPESRLVDASLAWLLPHWGFVEAGEKRWRVSSDVAHA